MWEADPKHRPINLIRHSPDKTGSQAEHACRCESSQDCASLIGGTLKPGPPQYGDQMPPFPVIVLRLLMFVDALSDVGRVGPNIFPRLATRGIAGALLKIPVGSSFNGNPNEASRRRKLRLECGGGATIHQFRIRGLGYERDGHGYVRYSYPAKVSIITVRSPSKLVILIRARTS